MKVTVDKDPKYVDPEIIVRCQELNDTLQDIISYIDISDRIIGEYEGEFCFIPTKDILYFESVDKAIFIYTKEKVCTMFDGLDHKESVLKAFEIERLLVPALYGRVSEKDADLYETQEIFPIDDSCFYRSNITHQNIFKFASSIPSVDKS